MKRLTRFFLSFLVLVGLGFGFCGEVLAFTGSGSGTEASPYLITNAKELGEVRENLTAYYKLANDVDLNNVEFAPIGEFKGTFNGDGHKIKNVKITQSTTDSIGLFKGISSGTIKNVDIENVNIIGKGSVGSLVGYVRGTIENCSVYGTGTVSGTGSQTGGLIGSFISGTLSNSSSSIAVNSTGSEVGGLIGYNAGNVTRCYATGDVTASGYYVGGLIGNFTGKSIKVSESYAIGNVVGNSAVGGLIGRQIPSEKVTIFVENCFALGSVTAASGGNGIILNNQAKSLNTIESKDDFANVFALGLANRKISGKIPKAIGELSNLEYLYLSNNDLTDGIPTELYTLHKLKNLDLYSADRLL